MSVRPSTKKKSIFEDDDDDNNNSSGNVDSLKVNEDFAAQFEKRKKFQELNACKRLDDVVSKSSTTTNLSSHLSLFDFSLSPLCIEN